MNDLIADFFRQNEWANLELIHFSRRLTDEQLDASAEGTFGSIRDTLMHILSSEAGYAFRLGREPEPRLRGDDPWPGFDALETAARANSAALIEFGPQSGVQEIQVQGDTSAYDVQTAVIAVQAFHHSTEHRSQVCTVITTLGLEPPELSAWDWALATDRMRKA